MVEKVLVVIKLPATQMEYEFQLPLDMTVEDCAIIVGRMLMARESALYRVIDGVDLMYLDGSRAGEIVNPKDYIRNLVLDDVLVNGSRLMVV